MHEGDLFEPIESPPPPEQPLQLLLNINSRLNRSTGWDSAYLRQGRRRNGVIVAMAMPAAAVHCDVAQRSN